MRTLISMVGPTRYLKPDSENILDIYNNEATSIKVRNGCTFKGYRYANKGDLMFTTVDDMEYLEDFDQAVSSYSCECASSKIYGLCQKLSYIIFKDKIFV